MNHLIKIFVFSLFLLASTQSNAFTKEITGQYIMGDGDSKVTARKFLIEKLKRQASDLAGVYIQGDRTLSSKEGFQETIKSISASIVKSKVIKEKISLTENGSLKMTITIRATIDESQLKERIKAIQGDARKQEEIDKLARKNANLQARLGNLRKQLAQKGLGYAKSADLIAEQSKLINKISANYEKVESVFNQGFLLTLANSKNNDRMERYNEYKEKYYKFWGRVAKNMTVTVKSVDKISNDFSELRLAVSINEYTRNNLMAMTNFKKINYNHKRRYLLFSSQQLKDYLSKYPDKQEDVITWLNVFENNPVYLTAGLEGKQNSLKIAGNYFLDFFGRDVDFLSDKKVKKTSYRTLIESGYLNRLPTFFGGKVMGNSFKQVRNWHYTGTDSTGIHYQVTIKVPNKLLEKSSRVEGSLVVRPNKNQRLR